MHSNPRLAIAIVATFLIAGCTGSSSVSTAPSVVVSAVTESPHRATADPCVLAFDRLGNFVARLAGDLAALRPLVLASPFDSPETVAAVRRASQHLQAFAGLEVLLGTCPSLASVKEVVVGFREATAQTLEAALDGSIYDAPRVRSGAAKLFALLPTLLAVEDAAIAAAAGGGIAFVPTNLADEETAPLGDLEPLPTPTPRATPRTAATPAPVQGPSTVALPQLSVRIAGSSQIKYIPIKGVTPTELLASMKAGARAHCSDRSGGACVHLDVNPDYSYVQDPVSGSCRLTGITWNRSFVVYMPRWTSPSRVYGSLLRWWREVLDHITWHEGQHIKIQNRYLADLTDDLKGLPCDQVQSVINGAFARASRAQDAFDDEQVRWQAPPYPGPGP